MKLQILALFILLLSIPACKTQKKATDDRDKREVLSSEVLEKPMVSRALFASTTDAVQLDTVFIHKDSLLIFTKKMVGCGADEFRLIWNGVVAQSTPPSVTFRLLHTFEPSCPERHQFHLAFSLPPFDVKRDTTTDKLMTVRVGGWKNELKYKYRSAKTAGTRK